MDDYLQAILLQVYSMSGGHPLLLHGPLSSYVSHYWNAHCFMEVPLTGDILDQFITQNEEWVNDFFILQNIIKCQQNMSKKYA